MIDVLAIAGLYLLIAGQYTFLIRNHKELTRLKAETRMCPYHRTLRDLNGN
ncbi:MULTISPECIES: hypothetical protein [unclassified Archaeoglobus]|uniref:hypothetical protein n=1 Tax=unclassified Archaeoglobus TaxID=2643606 RepID=UPI0025BD3E50|nr:MULTISPECIES: hypothetical protein [unclassified Archaeoglobus]